MGYDIPEDHHYSGLKSMISNPEVPIQKKDDSAWAFPKDAKIILVPRTVEVKSPQPEARFHSCNPPLMAPVGIDYDYDVKSWPKYFQPMIDGSKKHDMRNMKDRVYAIGDKVLLREWCPFGAGYSGRWALAVITYITSKESPCALSSAVLHDDFCILSVTIAAHGE